MFFGIALCKSLRGSKQLEALVPFRSKLADRTGIASRLVHRGLELLPGRDGAQMMEALVPMLKTHMESLETGHRMVIEGIAGVQAGKQPQEIAEIVRNAAA